MIKKLLLVGIGGFVGSMARYLVSQLNLSVDFWSIPIGTLTVNVTGSYIIGLLTGIAEKSLFMTPDLRLLLMVGLCGGFTTFSSFTNENLMLIHSDMILSFFIYTGISVILGLFAVYLGYITSNLL